MLHYNLYRHSVLSIFLLQLLTPEISFRHARVSLISSLIWLWHSIAQSELIQYVHHDGGHCDMTVLILVDPIQ
jgi:hypothetical protein